MNISGFINRDVHPQNFHLSISIVNKHTSLGQVESWIEPKKYQGHADCFKNGGSFRRAARLAQSCRVES